MIPLRLLTEDDRPALQRVIDRLEAGLTAAIIDNVVEGVGRLVRRGYRIHELAIHGFGTEISVEPTREVSAIWLWWRRILLACRLAELPAICEYGQIPISDPDTYRLVRELKIFDKLHAARSHASRPGEV